MSFRDGIDRMVARATLVAGLDPGTARIIKACNAVLRIKFPFKLRSGVKVLTG